MSRFANVGMLVVLASSLAIADKRERDPLVGDTSNVLLGNGLGSPLPTAPRFVFKVDGVATAPEAYEDYASSTDPVSVYNDVVGHAVDGKAAWVAVDVDYFPICGMAECMHQPPAARGHATLVYDGATKPRPIAWHVAYAVTGKEQAKAAAKGTLPDALPRKIDAGAEDVAKQFEATVGDAKALAKTVSDRKDVVLYGSELAERYVGGAKVRAQLLKWGLAFKVRDGVQAGVTASKTVAWVAANVDAGKPGDKKPTPYRALFVYEKHDAAWQVVQIHFSFYALSY
jgi:hypothetical protein